MGPVFARAKMTFYVVRCVGDKNQGMECPVHNFKEWSVLGTNPLFGSVPHTNFPYIYGGISVHDFPFCPKLLTFRSNLFYF